MFWLGFYNLFTRFKKVPRGLRTEVFVFLAGSYQLLSSKGWLVIDLDQSYLDQKVDRKKSRFNFVLQQFGHFSGQDLLLVLIQAS